MKHQVKQGTIWASPTEEFEILAVYSPNEEPDPWVKYAKTGSQQEYSCRLEAFVSRFRPRVD
jgi:hypothetical protein